MNAHGNRFGIEFEERKHTDAQRRGKLILQTNHADWFTPGLKFYGVDLAPLKIAAKHAVTLLAERETIMMSAVAFGKGRVVALGDPGFITNIFTLRTIAGLPRSCFASFSSERCRRQAR